MVLMAGFPAFKLNNGVTVNEMRNAYHLVLGDLDADLLKKVGAHLISTQTFFPSAGEIRRAAFRLAELGSGIPSAHEAWREVAEATRKGFYTDMWVEMDGEQHITWSERRDPDESDWSHPFIHEAVQLVGGWQALYPPENIVSDRARFLAAYTALLDQYRERERMIPAVREVVQQLGEGLRTPRKGLPERKQIAGVAKEMAF